MRHESGMTSGDVRPDQLQVACPVERYTARLMNHHVLIHIAIDAQAGVPLLARLPKRNKRASNTVVDLNVPQVCQELREQTRRSKAMHDSHNIERVIYKIQAPFAQNCAHTHSIQIALLQSSILAKPLGHHNDKNS